MPCLRYTSDEPRDRRLDLIRGYAVFAMSVNHFGLDRSLFHPFTGGAVFLINAAEVFFFVSGVTLGVVSRRKPIAEAAARCYRRSWQIYLYVFLLAFGAVLLGDAAFGDRRDFLAYIGSVAALREAPFWGDVLVAYVLYLLIAPAVLFMLSAGRTRTALAGIAGVYILSQVDPNNLALPFATFRNLAANAPIFLGALVLGWHRDTVTSWWNTRRARVPIDALVVTIGAALLLLYATNYRWWPALGAWMERYDFGTREYAMPFGALVIVALYLRCLWLLVDRAWLVLRRALAWLVMPLGKDALFAYTAHAFMMPAAWWVVSRSGMELDPETRLGATVITAIYIVLLIGIVRLRLWGGARVKSATGPARWIGPTALPGAAGLAFVIAFTAGPLFSYAEDDEDWDRFDEVHDVLYGELADFDSADAALVIMPIPVFKVEDIEEPEPEVELDEFAHWLAEIVKEELGEPSRTMRLRATRVEPDIELPLDELVESMTEADRPTVLLDDAAGADVILIMTTIEDEAEDAVDRLRDELERMRRTDPDALAIIATWLGE